ncbi:hypothetical protein Cfla_0085 [Cellulomonas flavigena DSM 20109]|uniref:Secreted protein n=1 Tax=Cellulomonas flavigena (strain ATCC 482 / DSM 20109 / BCRC 11376 / JCM 18109 / NBRC 3775 / NCIMB 8073 / NRS 134) TaxID=446466 RepID=D5UFP6_CELFN|nr:hypothetical protein [Cellulomonas flavigena]ADG73005.1 hypothetical protein Cfla_0085 [Cellulomonas flavigena DSM 20109]
MKNHGAGIIASAAAVVAISVLAIPAAANPSLPGGSDAPQASVTEADGSVLVTGGRTQSKDPTAWNYVEPTRSFGTAGSVPMDASGVGYTSPFQYEFHGLMLGIPTGIIGHQVYGSGLTVTSESANWGPTLTGTPAQICNYQWQFQNRYGSRHYSTLIQPLQEGCWTTLGFKGNFDARYTASHKRTMKTGLLCARLYVNGTFRGEQCHNVYP